jgi:C_GCAxxG_C_C family probable redox protein
VKHFDLEHPACGDLVVKAVLPLSGGIAQTRSTCGALLAGLMAIGIASFPRALEDVTKDDVQAVMTVGRDFYRRFEEEIGHARCFDIRQANLGRVYDTTDPDEHRKFLDAGGLDLCAGVCGKAARLAAEFLVLIKEGQAKA